MATVTVRYIGGGEVSGLPRAWPSWRADGVDWIELHSSDESSYRIQGQSIYWLYDDGSAWVAGGGIVGGTELIEARLGNNGFDVRRPAWMPDLPHGAVKLGWWLPGTRP